MYFLLGPKRIQYISWNLHKLFTELCSLCLLTMPLFCNPPLYCIYTTLHCVLNAANSIATGPREWDWNWVEEIFWSRQFLGTWESLFKSQISQSNDLFHRSFYPCWHNSNFCLLSRKLNISMCLLLKGDCLELCYC